MTISDSFWSFSRLAGSWSSAPPPPKPRRRAVFTQQHIETIGGGSDTFTPPPLDPTIVGDPRLPVELIVHIVFLAAADLANDLSSSSSSERLLTLARVSRPSHRAILSQYLLPDLTLYGFVQIRAFALALDSNRLCLRDLASSRVNQLNVRARSLLSLQHGYGPALFDASQAQSHFEKDLLPFLRIILTYCRRLERLHIEGVPRGLQRVLSHLSAQLKGFSCLMGHYGSELERHFWLPSRWNRLEELQLHGPRFRFTSATATTLASLPQLRKLALVVPMIVTNSPISDEVEEAGMELDLMGSINPLQILIDRCATLDHLLLIGHGEKDYVGYTEKYRVHLRGLRQPRLAPTKARVELVAAIRRCCPDSEEDRRRVHPSEVSAWIISRAQKGLQWFDNELGSRKDAGEELDFWVETFEIADHPSSTNVSSAVGTAATSALMSRTGSQRRQQRVQQQRTVDAIEAADMLSDDDDEEEFDEVD